MNIIHYVIIHDATLDHKDRYAYLCGDMYFYGGIWCGMSNNADTLIYKSLPAAKKRLGKVSQKKFPNAAVLAVQSTDLGDVTWIIRRDDHGTGPLRA